MPVVAIKSEATADTLPAVGWTVRLIDEHGAVLDEAASTEDAALARARWPDSFPRIAEIDPYGYTVFNKLQIPALLNELEAVFRETDNPREQQWLLELRALAERCMGATHLYLKIFGD